MTRSVIDLVGYAGAACNAISFVPQLVRVIKLRSARDISYSMFLIFAIGSGLWMVYGASVKSLPVMLANAITLLLSFSIFLMKLCYDGPRSPSRPSEESCQMTLIGKSSQASNLRD